MQRGQWEKVGALWFQRVKGWNHMMESENSTFSHDCTSGEALASYPYPLTYSWIYMNYIFVHRHTYKYVQYVCTVCMYSMYVCMKVIKQVRMNFNASTKCCAAHTEQFTVITCHSQMYACMQPPRNAPFGLYTDTQGSSQLLCAM